MVELGVPLAQVRDLLGHASILTTERYDIVVTVEATMVATASTRSDRMSITERYHVAAEDPDVVQRIEVVVKRSHTPSEMP